MKKFIYLIVLLTFAQINLLAQVRDTIVLETTKDSITGKTDTMRAVVDISYGTVILINKCNQAIEFQLQTDQRTTNIYSIKANEEKIIVLTKSRVAKIIIDPKRAKQKPFPIEKGKYHILQSSMDDGYMVKKQ